jgi:hypothetical protein
VVGRDRSLNRSPPDGHEGPLSFVGCAFGIPSGFGQEPTSLLLTLGLEAGIYLAMSYSHFARRISVRARRLSAGVWDMRIR